MAAPAQGGLVGMDLFDMIDSNKNGVITREEFMNAYGSLIAMKQAGSMSAGAGGATFTSSIIQGSGSTSPPAAGGTFTSGSMIQGGGSISPTAAGNAFAMQSGSVAYTGGGANYTGGSMMRGSTSSPPAASNPFAIQSGSVSYTGSGANYASGGGMMQGGGSTSPPAGSGSYTVSNTVYGAQQTMAPPATMVPTTMTASASYVPPVPQSGAPMTLPPTGSYSANAFNTSGGGAFTTYGGGSGGGAVTTYGGGATNVPAPGSLIQGMYGGNGTSYGGGVTTGGTYPVPSAVTYPAPGPPATITTASKVTFSGESDTVFGGKDLFLDDQRNWHAIADIAKALVIIESDEKLFMSEIERLPGGAEALKWLQGGGGDLAPGWEARVDPTTGKTYYVNTTTGETSWNKPVGGAEAALAKVKASIEEAKKEATEEAKEARQEAAQAKAEAGKAADMADTAEAFGTVDDIEHEALLKAKDKAAEEEKKADAEAKRLAEMARKAAADAADMAKQATSARDEAAKHHDYANHMRGRADEGKKAFFQMGPNGQVKMSGPAGELEAETTKKAMQAKRAQDMAARARQKAQDALARAHKLEVAAQPGGPLAAIEDTQAKVDDMNKYKTIALQAHKRVEGLQSLIALLTLEIKKAEQDAAQADAVYTQKQTVATTALQQTQAAQDALNLHVSGAGETGIVGHLTPEGVAQAIKDAEQEAARSEAEANKQAQIAQDLGRQAVTAENKLAETLTQQALPSPEELDEDAERATLAAQQAKAGADALAAAAAAAARHAQMAHKKAGKADDQLQLQQKHAQQVAAKEHAAFQKRFGGDKLPDGWKMYYDPATGKPYYVGPNGQVTWDNPSGAPGAPGADGPIDTAAEAKQEEARAAQLMDKANKKIEEAKLAEEQAKRMDWLIKAFEHAVKERQRLELLVKEARKTSQIIEKDVESWTEQLAAMPHIAGVTTETSTSAPPPPPGATNTTTTTYSTTSAPPPPPGGAAKTYGPGGVALDMFQVMDRNNDGAISKDEFLKYFAGNGGGNVEPLYGQDARMDAFDMIDRNHNGVITRQEFWNNVQVKQGPVYRYGSAPEASLGICDVLSALVGPVLANNPSSSKERYATIST